MNRKKLLCLLLAAVTVCSNFPAIDAGAQSPAAEQQEEVGCRETAKVRGISKLKMGFLRNIPEMAGMW